MSILLKENYSLSANWAFFSIELLTALYLLVVEVNKNL